MKKTFFLLCAIALTVCSCDKVNDPYIITVASGPTGPTGTADTAISRVRKVLVEDFTGHKCGNCPQAAIAIAGIKNTYQERLVPIAIHSNFYATPGAAPYTYDFRTTEGNDYDAFFTLPAQPIGLINRIDYPNNHWKSHYSWAAIVDTLMAIPPDAYIKIINNYNSATRSLSTSVRTIFPNQMSGTYKLIVLLTEDSVVKPQKDYSMPAGQQDVMNYIHRHVLRDGISSTSFGDQFVTNPTAGLDSTLNFQYTLPLTFPATNGIPPDENHCYVVAYIYDAATYEVVQVEETKLK